VKRYAIQWIVAGLGLLIATACGEVGGSGQCGGAESNGVCITIDFITPNYNEEDTSSVDVNFNPDCNLDGTLDDPEFFSDHNAVATFSSVQLTADDSIAVPPFVTFTSYQIDYTQNTVPAIGPPIATTTFNETINIDTGTTGNQFPLELVPNSTKDQYLADGGDPATYPSYTATYTFRGTDAFNNEMTLQGSTSFEIGGFNYCD
jgi:hypothetical protein